MTPAEIDSASTDAEVLLDRIATMEGEKLKMIETLKRQRLQIDSALEKFGVKRVRREKPKKGRPKGSVTRFRKDKLPFSEAADANAKDTNTGG